MDSCSPGRGRTYLTIGQDLFSIEEYVTSQYNYSLHEGRTQHMSTFAPAAAMFYTDLEKLAGLTLPTDYGSGVEYANGIAQSLFPTSDIGLQIGLWLNGTYGCDEINEHKMDEQLRDLSDYLEKNPFKVIFLRIGYEFDNPFFGYSDDPESYAQAYRYIVNFMRRTLSEQSYLKTKFVWHSWAAPKRGDLTLQDFYPGDEYVDWVGISVFQQLFPWSSNWANGYVNWGGDISDIDEVLKFAKFHKKPTMIAESTPFGGINLNNTNTVLFNETNPWDRWFGRVLSLIETYDIDMWSYINCDWDVQPMWRNIGFGDTRLSSNKDVMEKWQHYIIESQGEQTFVMSGGLTCDDSTEHMDDSLRSAMIAHDSNDRYSFSLGNTIQFSAIILCFFLLAFVIRRVVIVSFRRPVNMEGKVDEQTPLSTPQVTRYSLP